MPAPPPSAGGPQGPENFILNGGFEDGDGDEFTNWGKFNGADRMTQETEDVFEGSRALRVENPEGGDQFLTQLVSDGVPTENGAMYTASLWIKGGPGTIRFSTNASDGSTAQYGGDTEVTEDWSQIVFTFTANTDETQIVLDMGASAATYIVDDVQLISGGDPAPAPGGGEPTEPEGPENIVLNGGLEDGDNNEFANWSKFNGEDRMTQETEDVYEGDRAMRVVNPEDGEQFLTQFVSDAVPTENGAMYTASFWIKGGPGNVRISTNADTGETAQYGPDTDVTEDWSQVAYTFTANTDETRIVLDLGASAATYIVDSIELIEAEEEEEN
ncbi:MAG: carbohydrate binding domain-containing protein, partial [Pricia sp.]